jgi:hypothetical protein
MPDNPTVRRIRQSDNVRQAFPTITFSGTVLVHVRERVRQSDKPDKQSDNPDNLDK